MEPSGFTRCERVEMPDLVLHLEFAGLVAALLGAAALSIPIGRR